MPECDAVALELSSSDSGTWRLVIDVPSVTTNCSLDVAKFWIRDSRLASISQPKCISDRVRRVARCSRMYCTVL